MSLIARPVEDYTQLTDLSLARIGYQQVLAGADTSGSEVAINQDTYERITSASGTWTETFTTDSDASIDYIAIAGHNLGTKGSTISFQYATTIAGTDVEIDVVTPSDDKPIMILFDALTVREVTISVTGGTNREIAHIRAGAALVMQRPIYGGHNPINLSGVTEYHENISASGQFLGRSIVRQGIQTSYAWQNLDPDWVRSYFMPFVVYARSNAFFIKWRPDHHPDEVGYVHTTSDIRPSNMGGGHRLMSASMSVSGHSDT